MKFISIGPYCHTADLLNKYNLRTEAYPFDYIFSSLKMVEHCIQDKFKLFLNKDYYTRGTNPTSTRHSFYCKFLDTPLLIKHHIKFGYSSDYKVSSGNLFNHHNLIENENDYEAFQRRCNRLLNLIENESKEPIVFVYYNCYTNDYEDIIEFSNHFSKNETIYIIGIFENDGDKKIIYENKNCKIYQNYDTTTIINEMKSKQCFNSIIQP